jgi:hypothetical protein
MRRNGRLLAYAHDFDFDFPTRIVPGAGVVWTIPLKPDSSSRPQGKQCF